MCRVVNKLVNYLIDDLTKEVEVGSQSRVACPAVRSHSISALSHPGCAQAKMVESLSDVQALRAKIDQVMGELSQCFVASGFVASPRGSGSVDYELQPEAEQVAMGKCLK